MSQLKRVLIMAGGTGGHVFPGLAIAEGLRAEGIEVHWLGTMQGIEATLVPNAQFPLHTITIHGLRGKKITSLLLAPFKLLLAITQSIALLRRIKPELVIGMGGFASGPGGIASWLMRIKLIIHEQNAKSGLTNKCLAKIAAYVLTGFPDVFPKKIPAMMIGNPVRKSIAAIPEPDQRLTDTCNAKMKLLVIGGSLGASALNERLPTALARWQAENRPDILHQTGEKHLQAAKDIYTSHGVKAEIVPFIQDMAAAYCWADVVLCRAGALTIAELCAAGLGAILVPFPHAVDDHQTANAHYMVKVGAAVMIQQVDLTPELLSTLLTEMSENKSKRLAMARAAYQLRRVDATERMIAICKEMIN